MKTYQVKEVRHTWEAGWYADERACSKCGQEQEWSLESGYEVMVAGKPEACVVEVERCECHKSHNHVFHVECYEAEEHVCGPCECDCHYE